MSEKELRIPKFDGDYEHWAMLMENLLRSKEWWELVETGMVQFDRDTVLTEAQQTELSEQKLKDLKVKNYLFASIDKTILKTIVKKETSKDIWDSMKNKYQGNKRVQSSQLQRLRRNFEVLEMKDGDSITEYFSRVMMVSNDMRNLGEDIPDAKVVEKILRTLVEKYTYVVCAIEESKDITEMTVDELQSSLLVHEQNLSKHSSEEQVLKMEGGRGRGGYSQGRNSYRGGRGGRGRGSTSFNKDNIECYKCHKMGHFKNECPTWERNANYAELEEDLLLMAQSDVMKPEERHIWYLDSGCSNHMCGMKEWFMDFDGSYQHQVKLGDDRKMLVEGRGNVRLEIDGIFQVITSVYYVPGLKNNLMSVGQLQQKGLRIVIDDDVCEVWHKQQRRMIMKSTMSRNRMFIIRAKEARDGVGEAQNLMTVIGDAEEIWHCRFGHLSHDNLTTMADKDMVLGLPKLTSKGKVCEVCMKGKQIRSNIPKQSKWRASRCLELVHTDICGPIAPTSASGKRYIINFIDDYSRKCWTSFLTEKSEAFKSFKEFRTAAERESGELLVCLRSDRGGEYNSRAFQQYCVDNGIKRQLTTAYTPHQNGVAERKNRSLMNMVRCMLFGMKVPIRFWTEATQYAVHILNRSPTVILGNITPSEKWSSMKPSVDHLRVFGCIAYAHVPYERRVKLDEKSIKCVMFGVSKESKGYRLYDPKEKKILISKDVRFDEGERWDWEENEEDEQFIDEGEETTPTEIVGNNGGENENGAEEGEGNPPTPPAPPQDENEDNNPVQEEAEGSERTRTGRSKTRPVWMRDYEMGLFMEEEEDLMALVTEMGDPEKFEEAVHHEKWKQAMEAEMNSIEENNTWELVELPEGSKVIGVKWIFKTKLNEKGEVDKHKARLVAKGFHQTQGVDFYEVFAPVARWDTIRLLLSIAAQRGWCVHQLDVKSAFLHGELKEDVYVEQPKGFEVKNEERKVYKLNKALYGLRQAPRAWYSKIEGYFEKEGFKKCYCEHTLFVKAEGDNVLIVSVYVDDVIYTSSSMIMREAFKASMKKEFAMSDLGKMKYFLGVEVTQDKKGIFINQRKYASEVMKRFGMEQCNSVRNPTVQGCKLTKEGAGSQVDATLYKQIVGSLRYLTATRPDLIYSVNLVSRYMEKPTEQHLLAVKRILRYVQGTMEYGIQYQSDNKEELMGFVDSDYAGDEDDRKSTSGYVFMNGGGAISWASRKQPIVTLSTTEAEYVSAAAGACQAVWLRNVLEEIGCKQGERTVLFCDNSSTIKLSKNPVFHGRSKHIQVRFHFLRELVSDEIIELEYCSTQDQLADVMTKAVKLDVFEKLRGYMGVEVKSS